MLAGHGVRAKEPDTVFQTQAVMVIDQVSKGLVAILTEGCRSQTLGLVPGLGRPPRGI